MAQPYLGQIEAFAFNFPPKGWALCAGQILPISQNQPLFSLLGTAYGGDGIRSFGLPDLRSRLAMGQGSGANLTPRVIGQVAGEETHTLSLAEIPLHTHTLNVTNALGNVNIPGSSVVPAQSTGKDKDNNAFSLALYVADTNPNQAMAPAAIGNTSGQPHSNIMPYVALNFCIALQGVFPSRN